MLPLPDRIGIQLSGGAIDESPSPIWSVGAARCGTDTRPRRRFAGRSGVVSRDGVILAGQGFTAIRLGTVEYALTWSGQVR